LRVKGCLGLAVIFNAENTEIAERGNDRLL